MRTRKSTSVAMVAAVFGALSLGVSQSASAQCNTDADCNAGEICVNGTCATVPSPAGCTGNGAGASIVRDPSTAVVHGDLICYQVRFNNLQEGDCDVINFDSGLTLPDGTVVPISNGADLPNGAPSLSCPSAGA